MLKSERAFTTTYTGGAPNGIAVLRTDGSLLVQPDRGQKLVIEGVAQAVLEENAAYIAWREEQGGTPGVDPTDSWPPCAVCGKSAREGRHSTDLGEGHDYVPATPPEGGSSC